ncbi:MAG: hypothetical protein ACTS4U_00780 [Candidatus Hodgkinia cicadicola]
MAALTGGLEQQTETKKDVQPKLPPVQQASSTIETNQTSFLSVDPVLAILLKNQSIAQSANLSLGPSDNFPSKAIALVQSFSSFNEAASSPEVQQLSIERAKTLFKCKFANISANFGELITKAVLCSLLHIGDLVMELDFSLGKRFVAKSSLGLPNLYFNFVSFKINQITNSIDINEVTKFAQLCVPKLIFVNANSYPKEVNWLKLRKTADSVGAHLVADVSTISALIAAGSLPSPIPHCHVVITTTHESLKGPLGSLVMTNDPFVAHRLSFAPILQWSSVAAAQAVAFLEASSLEFKQWANLTVKNAKALRVRLILNGLSVISDGAANHLITINLKPLRLTWEIANQALSSCYISASRNFSQNDTSRLYLGTSALTSRGMTETQMSEVADAITEILLNLSTFREVSAQLEAKVRKFVLQLALNFPVYMENIIQLQLTTNSPKNVNQPSSS